MHRRFLAYVDYDETYELTIFDESNLNICATVKLSRMNVALARKMFRGNKEVQSFLDLLFGRQ